MPDLLTVPAAAKALAKPKMTLYRWSKNGKLITITIGGILFVPQSEVERLRASLNKKETTDE